jgi:hypothetical protein
VATRKPKNILSKSSVSGALDLSSSDILGQTRRGRHSDDLTLSFLLCFLILELSTYMGADVRCEVQREPEKGSLPNCGEGHQQRHPSVGLLAFLASLLLPSLLLSFLLIPGKHLSPTLFQHLLFQNLFCDTGEVRALYQSKLGGNPVSVT